LLLSLPGRAHTSAATYSLLHPLSPSLLPGDRSTEPHRAGARDGTAAPARRPARRGPVRARWVGIDCGGGKDPTTPHRAHLRRNRAAAPSATCPTLRTARGTGGNSTPCCLRPRFKRAPGRRSTDAKPPTPLGFSTFHRLCLRRIGRRRERAAAAPRRARKEPGAGPELRERITGVDHYTAGTPSTRQGRRRAAPEGGGREPAGDEEPEPRRTTTGVNTYPVCVHLSIEPATTPSPPHREHRPATLISSPPCSSSCDGSATSRRVAVISCLDAGHRAAELSCRDGWSSWAARALERRRRRAKNE
jgi:hypothetical protein